jgi:bifunctional non-homologous end joining protein LigD
MAAAELIRPMLAVAGELPPDGAWSFEFKWDGVRAVGYLGAGPARLLSRNDRDISVSYPELTTLGAAGPEMVLDGEVVAFDASGRPDFGTLQQRMHVTDPVLAGRLARSVPAVYLIFDLLRLDGRSLLGESYTERRRRLESLDITGDSWQTTPVFDDGADVLAASVAGGLEGVLAKRRDSIYAPGRRSADWRKIKNIRTQEVVIGGWHPGRGRRADGIGSLMMGLPEAGALRYVGQVGTGFSDAVLASLGARLAGLERRSSPFADDLPGPLRRDAHWVEPELVGEVAFTEWTGDGVLRHPAWRGLRPDKTPGDVTLE